jgi:membrane protein
LRYYWDVLKASIRKFADKGGTTHASAMSFGMVFSFPPMLFIILWVAGRFQRDAEMRNALFAEMEKLVGEDGALQLMATVENVDASEPTRWATALALGVLVFAASSVLVSARTALNSIFEVETSEAGLWTELRGQFVSSAMLFTLTTILLVSLVVEALIASLGAAVERWLGELSNYVLAFDYLLFDLVAITVLVAMFFRYLPDAHLRWKDIWAGAAVTAGLFSVGQYLIGFLIGESQAATFYDAAGSVLVLMLWVFYASAIFLFGASFTSCRAELLRGRSP